MKKLGLSLLTFLFVSTLVGCTNQLSNVEITTTTIPSTSTSIYTTIIPTTTITTLTTTTTTLTTTPTTTVPVIYSFKPVSIFFTNYQSKFVYEIPLDAQYEVRNYPITEYEKKSAQEQFDLMLTKFALLPENSQLMIYPDGKWDFIVPGLTAANAPIVKYTAQPEIENIEFYFDSECKVPFEHCTLYGGYCNKYNVEYFWTMAGEWSPCVAQGNGWEETSLIVYLRNNSNSSVTAWANDNPEKSNSLGYISSPKVTAEPNECKPIKLTLQFQTDNFMGTGKWAWDCAATIFFWIEK